MGIRRDHPRLRIEMKFCVVGGLQIVVLRFEFHQNRLSGFGAVGIEICPSPLTWPLAYTTACTTVQAVKSPTVHQPISVRTRSHSVQSTILYLAGNERKLFMCSAEVAILERK